MLRLGVVEKDLIKVSKSDFFNKFLKNRTYKISKLDMDRCKMNWDNYLKHYNQTLKEVMNERKIIII